jgi:hypothetical protein
MNPIAKPIAIRSHAEMTHCIRAIVAPSPTADAISVVWPELPRLNRGRGFAIFPADATLIDARIAPESTPLDLATNSCC